MYTSKHTHLHPDWLQLFLLGVCAFDLIFFSCYLFIYELNSKSMISDTLFTTPAYAIVLTITLFTRLLGVALFLYRYGKISTKWVTMGFFGVFLTMFGWGWLVFHKDNTNHFTGVFLFCLGSVLYSISLVRLASSPLTKHEHLHNVHLAMEAFLLISSGILCVCFVALWFSEESNGQHDKGNNGQQNAYIVEHITYVTHVLFYATFFLYHSPDINKPAELGVSHETEDGYYVNNNSSVRRPLIHAMTPLTPIMELN